MHILLLFHHYRTLKERGGLRSYQIGTYLRKKGYDVSAVIPGIDPLTENHYPGLRGKLYLKENIRGVNIYRVNSLKNRRSSKLSRILYFISSACIQFIVCMRIRSCDVVICTSLPPSLLFWAFILSRLRGIPLIVDVRDLPFDYSVETHYFKQNTLVRLAMKLEATIYKRVEAIVTISQGLKKMITDKGVHDKRVSFLPIGYDRCYYEKNIDWTRDIKKEFNLKEKFIVLYTGSMGSLVDIMTILNAAELTRNKNNIIYVFVGDGQRITEYKQIAKERKLQSLFTGEVSKETAILFSAASDVCVYALGDNWIFSTFLGNKVFDYLGTGKPMIFCGPDGDISRIIHEVKGGICLPPKDFQGLSEAIVDLHQNPKNKIAMGNHAKHLIEIKYDTENLIEHLEKIIYDSVHTNSYRIR